MSENKECLFYIDHNPPECSGTWGGAIHKGACKVNSTDCKDTDGCFIKNLYSKLQAKEQECEFWQTKLNKTHLLMLDKQDKYIQSLNENEELKKQLQEKQQECEELHSRTASIIYSLTGGRLSYSTYTLEGCEQAYHDQLEIDVERATKELQEENETLKQEVNKFKQALDEIEEFCTVYLADHDAYEMIYKDILTFINKAKEQ